MNAKRPGAPTPYRTPGAPIPYRVPAPTPDEAIRWPAAFGTRFTVFADVEEQFDWGAPFSRGPHAVSAIRALPSAHRRFADLGAALTCMVDYPIADDPAAAAILSRVAEDGRSAIGAQLHPWVNPPFEEALSAVNSYAGNLPATLEAAKLDALTDRIAAATGHRPICYRAGRYGIGPHTLALLAERGYRLDSSMRSAYDYRANGGPDFSAIGPHAFRRGGLVELPLTTVFTGALRRQGAWLHRLAGQVPRGPGVLARAGLVNRVALTPEDMPIEEALAAVEVAVAAGVRLLAFSFHSPSLEPGHTPYVRDERDLASFWRWWDRMAQRLARLGVHHASLDEILAAAG